MQDIILIISITAELIFLYFIIGKIDCIISDNSKKAEDETNRQNAENCNTAL